MASSSQIVTSSVLGKRKTASGSGLVLHLAPSDSDYAGSESDAAAATSAQRVVIDKRPYLCTHPGCSKAYSKPSRLAEHERSHTGERPYVCASCGKAYFRENHLQAHSRTHLPESDKPFACVVDGCGKRYWTSQHLRVHGETHTGEKPFKCTDRGCDAGFSKQSQLLKHVSTAHAVEGTKPYMCTHAGCTKSFLTNQKLQAHLKTHEDKRYTCVHTSCLPAAGASPVYYPTWTALQHHVRTAHPPTCPHASCAGRTFTHQKGLRAHLKLHEQREVEAALDATADADAAPSDADEPVAEPRPRKRRRGGEIGRDWTCDVAGCAKDFKSKRALMTHRNVTHLGRRDFVCEEPACGRAFGYKHLLQRHAAKVHTARDSVAPDSSSSEHDEDNAAAEAEAEYTPPVPQSSAIDMLTGKMYASRRHSSRSLHCPYPRLDFPGWNVSAEVPTESSHCDYYFTRAYDLRRHLAAVHDVEVDKEPVDEWTARARARS